MWEGFSTPIWQFDSCIIGVTNPTNAIRAFGVDSLPQEKRQHFSLKFTPIGWASVPTRGLGTKNNTNHDNLVEISILILHEFRSVKWNSNVFTYTEQYLVFLLCDKDAVYIFKKANIRECIFSGGTEGFGIM